VGSQSEDYGYIKLGIDMKTFVVVNDSTGAKQEMDLEALKSFFVSLDMPEFDTEVMCCWADSAESGETTNLCMWVPYYIMCL
jgi:hypothetical protein